MLNRNYVLAGVVAIVVFYGGLITAIIVAGGTESMVIARVALLTGFSAGPVTALLAYLGASRANEVAQGAHALAQDAHDRLNQVEEKLA